MTEHEALQEAVRRLLIALRPVLERDHLRFHDVIRIKDAALRRRKSDEIIELDKAFWLCAARVKVTDKAWGVVKGGNLADRGYFTGVVEDGGEQIPCVKTYKGMGWTLQDVGFRPDDPVRAEALLDIAIQEAKSK